ncbi:MAG TPA: helix-turn-helix domain-containing protein [Pseudonocardia sp.]|jgi:excisionase family DNA binding protein|uniref:helix-turn-helix domain-containing protein n=1 Tax=Pseudonocardia sp. TaxID=60912 RepID=UPI002CA9B0B1|nr:helix-turn-helix domain-containing protein [Pseudonocardia sp.]HTF53231.1 helix-turn-helix domain-containing protein [Pseudonocardia sp.]
MRQDLYYSVSEAAAALNVSKMTVYRHIHTGRLDAIRVGTSYRVSATSLERITTIARDQPA